MRAVDSCSVVGSCRRTSPGCGRGSTAHFGRMGCHGRCGPTNGPPFATTGAGQLSALAVWWLKLGIQVDRIDQGHPEQNGRHERFHLTLQQETATPPAPTPQRQQARFDRLRREFNAVRPHEALGQLPPARRYTASPVPIPRGSRSRAMTPHTRCAASGTMARSSGAASWCSSARRSDTSRWDWRKPSGAIGACGSCTSNWGASIATPVGLRRRGTVGGGGRHRDREDRDKRKRYLMFCCNC